MLKTTSGSSLGTDLSSNITFSQSKSHATVPLIYHCNIFGVFNAETTMVHTVRDGSLSLVDFAGLLLLSVVGEVLRLFFFQHLSFIHFIIKYTSLCYEQCLAVFRRFLVVE
jgi:hypothetical protein